MKWIWRWAATVAAMWIVAWMFDGIRFDSAWDAIVAAVVLGVINVVINPVFQFLALPVTVLTFGLFALVINTICLLVASSIVAGFHVDGFWTAFWGSIVLGLITGLLNGLWRE
ncbi:MAG: phage holin family protein [Tumebacillaceae bacterium]